MPATDRSFPHTVSVPTGDDSRLLRNEVYGISILIGRSSESGKPSSFFKVSRPTEASPDGEGAVLVQTQKEAQAAYAALWMEAAAVGIGLGFHPDTPAENYSPALEPDLAAQYDDMIGFCHDHLEDPYAVGYDAWEKAGLITPSPSA